VAQSTAQQEAKALSVLLYESALERQQVTSATAQIASCGDVAGAQNTLNTAASQRQDLLNELEQVDLAALPNSTSWESDLQTAWQASESSDSSYAAWAQDELNFGCTQDDTSDSNYQTAQNTDQQATSAKETFVRAWDPIAYQYNEPTFTADQI
jgi:hypothetical protein